MTEEERLNPQPYTQHLYTTEYICRDASCDTSWEEHDVHEGHCSLCPVCGESAKPCDWQRNINMWSLTPRGERL